MTCRATSISAGVSEGYSDPGLFGGLPGDEGGFGHDAFPPVSAVRLLGVLGQQAHQQQRQKVEARCDAEDQFCGGKVGVHGRVPDPGEEHRAEGGNADGAGERWTALTVNIQASGLGVAVRDRWLRLGCGDGVAVVAGRGFGDDCLL